MFTSSYIPDRVTQNTELITRYAGTWMTSVMSCRSQGIIITGHRSLVSSFVLCCFQLCLNSVVHICFSLSLFHVPFGSSFHHLSVCLSVSAVTISYQCFQGSSIFFFLTGSAMVPGQLFHNSLLAILHGQCIC